MISQNIVRFSVHLVRMLVVDVFCFKMVVIFQKYDEFDIMFNPKVLPKVPSPLIEPLISTDLSKGSAISFLLIFSSFSDYYNMETSGVVSLKRGDVITLWVESKLDANYVINQDSHFSVIMLSEAGGRYASGGQLMLHPAITQRETVMNTFMKVIGWVSNRPQTAPGLFLTGKGCT